MTDLIQIRKTIITLETIRHENGPIPDQPVRRGAALIVMMAGMILVQPQRKSLVPDPVPRQNTVG